MSITTQVNIHGRDSAKGAQVFAKVIHGELGAFVVIMTKQRVSDVADYEVASFPTDAQAEQIHRVTGQYLRDTGKLEQKIDLWECPSCRARWHGCDYTHKGGGGYPDNACPGCGINGRKTR